MAPWLQGVLMKDQIFELENYRGPLDLLLHLIREQEMEITDVDLSLLCDQYLAELEVLKSLDVNVAGEFLVLASTLVLIKSRAILPHEEVDLAEELDPGDELIMQLLEYRKYKSLAFELDRRAGERSHRHGRGAPDIPAPPEPELEELGIWELVGSYSRLVEELGLKRSFHTLEGEKPLREYMRNCVEQLSSSRKCRFREMVKAEGGGVAVFAVFLSILELVRTGQVIVEQEKDLGDFGVRLREDRDVALLDDLLGSPEVGSSEESTSEALAHPSEDRKV